MFYNILSENIHETNVYLENLIWYFDVIFSSLNETVIRLRHIICWLYFGYLPLSFYLRLVSAVIIYIYIYIYIYAISTLESTKNSLTALTNIWLRLVKFQCKRAWRNGCLKVSFWIQSADICTVNILQERIKSTIRSICQIL